MFLETDARPWRKARKTNQTSTSYVAKDPATTVPEGDAGTATGASVIDLTTPDRLVGGVTQSNRFIVIFFGAGSDTNTFSCRLLAWKPVAQAPQGTSLNGLPILWVPLPLVEVSVALSVQTGVAGSSVINTDLFADTITLTGTTANAGQGIEIVSPGNNTIAHMIVDLKGAMKVEFTFSTGGAGGSATNCNALYAPY